MESFTPQMAAENYIKQNKVILNYSTDVTKPDTISIKVDDNRNLPIIEPSIMNIFMAMTKQEYDSL